MSHLPSDASAAETQGQGRLILVTTLLGTVLVPLATYGVMLLHDQFDPMCVAGGEGRIACATRAFVVTVMSVLPGLLIGVVSGRVLASRRAAKRLS